MRFTKKQIETFNPDPFQDTLVFVQIIHLFLTIQLRVQFRIAETN